MKITDVTCYPTWGGGRNFLFVVVDTDEGIYGVGESGLTGRELAVAGAIDHFRPLLLGQDPRRIEHIWQVLSRGGFFPHGKILGSAIAAIDIALWDIKGKALGVPVYDLLGGLVRDKVVCYCHLGGQHRPGIEGLVESAREHVAQGWRFLRWGLPNDGELLEPGPAIRQSVAQFRALREAVGDEVELCFDIHTRLSPADAILLCREAAPFRPFFMEDPIRSESPQAFHLLRQKLDVPIAAGEQFASKWDFRELIDHDLIDYARIDLCIAAGLTEGKKIAGWCEGHYIDIVVHNPLGPVSTTACTHFNLAIPNFGVQEQPRRPGISLTDVVRNQPLFEDGCILPPQGPGLGLEFDREAAAAHPFQMAELPHLHRLDGSFTNW
ncbi:MAG: mandelate racemase/muconate lactonizing enzyme family protein [Chloroflexi bacterium]|nr:mandelate racemase/muconate lactonizing enzyme family protein [Chloroflexota bacterium]